MKLQNDLESKELVISQHTDEICEWIDLFLSKKGDDTLIIVTPPRYGKTEICKTVRDIYEDVSYEGLFSFIRNPSATIHIFDDLIKNIAESKDLEKNINLALRIKETTGKKIVIGSSYGTYSWLSLLSRMNIKKTVLQFPASRYKFKERYNQEWHNNLRSNIGSSMGLFLMECEI